MHKSRVPEQTHARTCLQWNSPLADDLLADLPLISRLSSPSEPAYRGLIWPIDKNRPQFFSCPRAEPKSDRRMQISPYPPVGFLRRTLLWIFFLSLIHGRQHTLHPPFPGCFLHANSPLLLFFLLLTLWQSKITLLQISRPSVIWECRIRFHLK